MFDNDGDDFEQRRLIAFTEALFVDYMQSLGPVLGRKLINLREGAGYVNVSNVMDAYNAVRPDYRVRWAAGLNTLSPWN